MREKCIKRWIVLIVALLAAMLASISCSTDTADQIESIGERVVRLEENMQRYNGEINKLTILVEALKQRCYITDITTDAATQQTTITFSNRSSVVLTNGRDGRDGQQLGATVGIAKDITDGNYYWTLGNGWMLDADGQRVSAGANDGSNGKDARFVVPVLRAGADGCCEYSTDGGATWISTRVALDGKDGLPDIFKSVVLSADGLYVIITLNNGQQFTIPLRR